MRFVSIAQYNELAYRQIFTLAQKVKEARHRAAATLLLKDKHFLILVRADNEPHADLIETKLVELGGSVSKKYFSTISHESKMLEDTNVAAIFTIGCTHSATLEIATLSHAPVINVCSSKHNPVHVLADIFPVFEKRGFNFKDVSFCWHGFSENSAHSWLEAAHVLGFKFSLVPSRTLHLDQGILATSQQPGNRIVLKKSFPNADVTVNETSIPHSKRVSLSPKVEDYLSNRNNGREAKDAEADFWDNELCILIAIMIWVQE